MLHGRHRIWHLVHAHEILAAHLDRIDAEIACGDLDHALDEKATLEATRRAIGAARRLVRETHRNIDMNIRDAVRPGRELRDVARRSVHSSGRKRRYRHRHGRGCREWCRLRRRRFRTRLPSRARGSSRSDFSRRSRSFHRPSEKIGCERDQEVFRMNSPRAKAAADIVLDQFNRSLIQAQHLRDRAALKNSTFPAP